jgi:hypothetical protein
VRVPQQGAVSDAELLRRYKVLYPEPTEYAVAQIETLEAILEGNGPDAQKLRDKLLARMNDLSQFMKTFKQRYSIWFNRNHKRFGPLWAERFSSTIIEGDWHFAVQVVAAYIDLNPVRAGLVKDPKDYRWCGYGEAEAVGGKMLEGLRQTVAGSEKLSDKEVLAAYRLRVFGKGISPKRGDPKSASIRPEDFAGVLDVEGNLSDSERLALRTSWFTHGGVIGGRQFVEEHLGEYQKKTKRRLRMLPHSFDKEKTNDSDWSSLYSMRRGA